MKPKKTPHWHVSLLRCSEQRVLLHDPMTAQGDQATVLKKIDRSLDFLVQYTVSHEA